MSRKQWGHGRRQGMTEGLAREIYDRKIDRLGSLVSGLLTLALAGPGELNGHLLAVGFRSVVIGAAAELSELIGETEIDKIECLEELGFSTAESR